MQNYYFRIILEDKKIESFFSTSLVSIKLMLTLHNVKVVIDNLRAIITEQRLNLCAHLLSTDFLQCCLCRC